MTKQVAIIGGIGAASKFSEALLKELLSEDYHVVGIARSSNEKAELVSEFQNAQQSNGQNSEVVLGDLNDSQFIKTEIERLEKENGIIHYDLDSILRIIEDTIREKDQIKTPNGVTEFERILFTARRMHHNDSQLAAIKLFKYLLDYEWYRTEGEKIYIKLLLASSLDYIGASYLSKTYLDNLVPEFLKHLEDKLHYRFFLEQYAVLAGKIKNFEEAKKIYQLILQLSVQANDTVMAYKARNNIGYNFERLKRIDSAAFYYRGNMRQVAYKKLCPVYYAFSFGNYARLLQKEAKHDSAVYFGKKEIQLLKEVPTTESMRLTYGLIAKSLTALGKTDSALLYYNLGLAHSLNDKDYYLSTRLHKGIIEISLAKKNYDAILNQVEQTFQYLDSTIEHLTSRVYRDEMQIFNYLEILDDAHRTKEQVDQLETNHRELIYGLLGLIIFLVLVIAFLIFRKLNRKELEEVNKTLIEKNEELEISHDKISVSNEKNEVLLKELHHRVKNNLQIIISLFNLQLSYSKLDSDTIHIFKEAQSRVYSISLIHKKIYHSDNFNRLNFGGYLKTLSEEIKIARGSDVDIQIEVEDVDLNIDSAIPLGLIFNELFTNSFEHASTKEKLLIKISHEKLNNESYFTFTDNGQGIDTSIIGSQYKKSMGITLINLLASQLDSNIEYKGPKENEYGFWFGIRGNFF